MNVSLDVFLFFFGVGCDERPRREGAVRVLQDFAPPAGGCGKLAPWWFADALVIVASAGEEEPVDSFTTPEGFEEDGEAASFGAGGGGGGNESAGAVAAGGEGGKGGGDGPGGEGVCTDVDGMSTAVQHPPLPCTTTPPTSADMKALSDSPVSATWNPQDLNHCWNQWRSVGCCC